MLFHGCFTIAVAAIFGAGAATTDIREITSTDGARLQGTWSIVSVECGGKKEEDATEKYTFSFRENSMFFLEHDNIEAVVHFKLDDTRFPRRITFGRVKGVYDFQDENLHICYTLSGKRPTSFSTAEDRPNEVWMILKKTNQP